MLLTQVFFKIISMSRQAIVGLLIVITATLLLSACGGESKVSLEERMERALNWQSDGNLKAAVIELKNALITYPDSKDARFLLGRVYLELGMGFAAENEIKKSATLGIDESITILPLAESWLLQRKFDLIIEKISYDSDSVTLISLGKRNFLGSAHLGKGEIKTAEDYFDEVLLTTPGNMRALVGKARISFLKKDIDNTDKYIALAEDILPNDMELLQLKAGRSWFAKDFDAVEGYYSRLVEYYPSFYINEIYLVWVKIINGKSEGVGDTLLKFRKVAPENGLVNYVSAIYSIVSQNYSDAKIFAEKALIMAPSDTRTIFIAAMATFALDENEQSYSYIQQYLDAIPDDLRAKELLVTLQVRMNRNEEAYVTLKDMSGEAEKKEKFLNILASYELQKGDIEQARLHLEQSLEENPQQIESRRKLALMKISEGEIEDGLREMEKALEGVTDDYLRKMQRARILIIASRYDEAIVNCREIQKIDPKNVNGLLCEGTALYKKGDLQQALTSFKEILAQDPGNQAASRLATSIHLKNNALEKAQEVHSQYLKLHPTDAQSTYDMYLLKLRSGNNDEAIELLKKSVELDPNAHMPVLHLARHYLVSNQPEKTLTVSDKIMPLFPKSAGLFEVRGKAQMALNQFDSAARTFEKLVKEKQNNYAALMFLASAYDANKDYVKLDAVAQKILSLKSDDDRAKIFLAKAEAAKGNWQKVDDILSEVKADYNNDVDFSSLRGRVKIVNKDYEKAIFYFDKSFQNGKSTAALQELVAAYRLSGKIETAINLMEGWIQKHPNDMVTTSTLGNFYIELENFKKAIEKYNFVLKSYPTQPRILNNLAWSYYKMDNLDEALSTIRKAREINPNFADYLDTEAEILLAKGQVSGAIRQYKKAVDNAPNNLMFKYHLVIALVKDGQTTEAIEILKDLKRDGRPFEGQIEAFDLLEKLTTE